MGDLRYAVQSLRRVPVFTLAAVGSLTLGIATTAVVFSLVNAAILRPLPFPESSRLMVLNITQHTPSEGELRVRWSWPRFRLLENLARSFDGIASSSNAVVTLTGVGDPEPVRIEIVSSRYLSVLRMPLSRGYGFTPQEDDPQTASRVAILGHDLWQRRFGGAEDIVGRSVELNGVSLVVVGVAGPGFAGVSGLAQAWIPAPIANQTTYAEYLTTNQNFITVLGRLRPGVSVEAARAELHAVGERVHQLQPSDPDTPEDRFAASLIPLNVARVDVVTKRGLLLLAGGAAVLLLIACANVASLLLGRATTRRREIAIRLAVGAGRYRLVRQLLAESAVLAGLSAGAGLLIAGLVMPVVHIPPTLARGVNFYGAVGEFAIPSLDWRVIGFTLALSGGTVLLFGLLPSLRATRSNLIGDLRSGGHIGPHPKGTIGVREMVVSLQVSLAVVLLVGCGLLLTSYTKLRQTPLGFDPARLLTFMVRPSEVAFSGTSASQLVDRILDEVEQVPGVEAVTVDGCAPLSTQCASATLFIEGRGWEEANAPTVLRHYVGPAHARTLGVLVVRGRMLQATDRAGAPRVTVINEAAARRFWPGEDPVGKRVWFGGPPAFGSRDSSAEVVGIIGDVAYQPIDEQPIQPSFFTSYAQFTYPSRMVLVRTRGEPAALVPDVTRAVRRAHPTLALFDVQTMESRASLSWSKRRSQSLLLVIIASVALTLAISGVYAVTSYLVASRTRDIGVRMALGAWGWQIVREATARTFRLGLIGLGTGLLGAFILSQLLRATLYQTSTLEPVAYAGGIAVLLAAMLAASFFPVRRATRVNPVDTLRTE